MSREKWLFLFSVALIIAVLDQVTKALVATYLEPFESFAPIEALAPYFNIVHVTNTGAAFGILQGGNTLFSIVALVVVGIILYFYRQLTSESWLVRLALGMQLGGAVGNLIDRVRLGYVVDFLDFRLPGVLNFPVFNVADSGVVLGVGLLLLLLWFDDRRGKRLLAAEAAERSAADDDTATTQQAAQQPVSHD